MAINKSLKSKLSGGHAIGSSGICFIIFIILGILIQIFVVWRLGVAEAKEHPQLIAKTLYKEVLQYHDKNARFPKDLQELNKNMWSKDNRRKDGVLYGGNDYRYQNYLYIYYAQDHVVSLWAIPQGKFASETSPIYLLITPKKMEFWKGASLSKEEETLIPRVAVPNVSEMARLGMVKQQESQKEDKSSGGLFDFFPKL